MKESDYKSTPPKVEPISIGVDESIIISDKSAYDSGQASPAIWVPLSLLVAVIYACGNITNSVVSRFEIKARYLQAPGSIVGNGLPLIIISFYDKYFANKDDDDEKQQLIGEVSYFKWFNDIYFYTHWDSLSSQDTQNEDSKPTLKVHWPRVYISILMGAMGIAQAWCFFISYHYASIANLNNGILMSMYSMKPIFTSIFFYVIFKQRLKWFEIAGIALCVVCTILIAFSSSHEDKVVTGVNTTYYIFVAGGFLTVSLLLIGIRTVMIKFFFDNGKNKVNISAFFNFNCLCVDIIFFILYIVELYKGFEFTPLEFWGGTIGGCVFSLAGYIMAYVNIRGKAGTSDALIETGLIYQTILDAFFFDRYPNIMQVSGLIVGLFATLLIIICHQIEMKKS